MFRPQQLRDQHFVQDVQHALASQEGLQSALEVEITESLLMEDIERNIERLKTLRNLGVTIAIGRFRDRILVAELPCQACRWTRSRLTGRS